MNNYDEMNAEQRYDALEKDFNAAVEQKDGIPGYGLEGAVVPPKAGFGLTEEDVNEQSQPEMSTTFGLNPSAGMPTEEEIEAAKQKVDGMVYESVRQDDFNNRTNNLFNSLESKNDPVPPVEPVNEQNSFTPPVDGSYDSILASLRSKKEIAEQRVLDQQLQGIKEEPSNRKEFLSNVTAETSQYIMTQKQAVHVEERELDPSLVEKLKGVAKKALIGAAIIGVSAAVVAGAHSVFTEPEFVPEQTPQSIELQEQIDNAENFDQVVDAINDNKQQNIESGITTHPEHVIEDNTTEVVEEPVVKKTDVLDSMQQAVDEVNRQKVISIESGITTHPEHVVDSNEGGRGL